MAWPPSPPTPLRSETPPRRPALLVRRSSSADFSTVIVATDFSDNAKRAAQFALNWSPSSSHLVAHAYFVPFEGRMRMAGATSDDIDRDRNDEQARAQNTMKSLRELLDIPEATRAQWVNLRGHSASVLFELSERLLGSVAQNVLYYTSSNVLLVP